MTTTKVGTVEILCERIYSLDTSVPDGLGAEVVVSPGTYDLYKYVDSYFWMMSGVLNEQGLNKIGDGSFLGVAGDSPSDISVRFPSKRFGSEEFKSFMESLTCEEGSVNQRLRITLTVEAAMNSVGGEN